MLTILDHIGHLEPVVSLVSSLLSGGLALLATYRLGVTA
jgi:hypothetical protein